VLISILTTSFLTEIEQNPDVPDDLSAQAEAELASGIPFVTDADLEVALDDAEVPDDVADAVVQDYSDARINGLRASLSILALMALLGLVAARRLPTAPASGEVVAAEAPFV
jgi:hypothetical protein